MRGRLAVTSLLCGALLCGCPRPVSDAYPGGAPSLTKVRVDQLRESRGAWSYGSCGPSLEGTWDDGVWIESAGLFDTTLFFDADGTLEHVSSCDETGCTRYGGWFTPRRGPVTHDRCQEARALLVFRGAVLSVMPGTPVLVDGAPPAPAIDKRDVIVPAGRHALGLPGGVLEVDVSESAAGALEVSVDGKPICGRDGCATTQLTRQLYFHPYLTKPDGSAPGGF